MSSPQKKLNISYREIGRIEELSEIDKHLIDTAMQACNRAYAPYSTFHVGSAVLLEGGLIVSGSNQENAAYPSGICAERVAVFSASSEYPERIIQKIAIVAKDNNGQLRTAMPCGSCRQVLYEYEVKQNHPVMVLVLEEGESILEFTDIASLLPFGFNKEHVIRESQ